MSEPKSESVTPTATAPIPITAMELTLRCDMPGFAGAKHFVVEPLGEGAASVFAHLRCTDTLYSSTNQPLSNLTLLVMSPGFLWRDYEVRIDDAMVEELDLSGPDDAALLVIVHPRDPLTESTANLYSPIIVNRRTGVADQFIPGASEQEVGWTVRTPFPFDRDD
jgi:flagellar assembly factor FliW